MPIFWVFKNENLHSVGDIRSLGVCQSSGVSRMRIFILLKVSGAWVYANLLRSHPRLGIKVYCYLVDFQALR